MNFRLVSLPVAKKILLLPAMFITALAAIVTYTVITLGAQKQDAQVAALSGRQRMLTQKYTKEVLTELISATAAVQAARGTASAACEQIAIDRNYYTKNVVLKLKGEGSEIKATPFFHGVDNAIPTPATFVREAGDALNGDTHFKPRLLSKWNIHPDKGITTPEDQAAWDAIVSAPNEPHSVLLEKNGVMFLDYVAADMAGAGCVSCHNEHADSPKTDWAEGEVMGILSLRVPLTSDPAVADFFLGNQEETAGESSAALFEATIAAMQNGGQTFADLEMKMPVQVAALQDKDMQETLTKMQDSWEQLLNGVAATRESARDPLSQWRTLDALVAKSNEALGHAHVLVGQLTKESEAKIASMIRIEIILGLLVAAIGGLLARKVSIGIVRPLGQTNDLMHDMAAGNLVGRLDDTVGSDMGHLAHSVNRFLGSIGSGLSQVQTATSQIADSSSLIRGSSQSLAASSSEQSASMEDISAAIEEISITAASNAEHAYSASTISAETRDNAAKSTDETKLLTTAMNEIQESSQDVSRVIKVIDEIAFQTNLLALNAAVEAARAGEAGKGFAVVAGEVRSLAQRCAEAAKDTSGLIQESSKRAQNGTDMANRVASSLATITEATRGVNSLLGEITSACKEQDQGLQFIKASMEQVDQATQANAASAEELAATVDVTSSQVQTLTRLTGQYQLPDESAAAATDLTPADLSSPAAPFPSGVSSSVSDFDTRLEVSQDEEVLSFESSDLADF
ncbi:MAG: methyl-accepting chemotaxis protein [bacterium]|nr:methyl-accepting chemotaxis protein [bacterium]